MIVLFHIPAMKTSPEIRWSSKKLSKKDMKLPGKDWKWESEWKVFVLDKKTDKNGWEYALTFSSEYKCKKETMDVVRRRKWTRTCYKFVYEDN